MKLIIAVFTALLSVSFTVQALTPAELKDFAEKAEFGFEVIDNTAPSGPQVRLLLNNQSAVALAPGAGAWRIYFHSVRRIDTTGDQGLTLSHVQGDLHQLAPTTDFKGLPVGEVLSVSYQPHGNMSSFTDFMPRAFITAAGGQPHVFANTDTEDLARFVAPFDRVEQQKRNAADRYDIPTPESRYQRYAPVNAVEVTRSEALARIIPKPVSVQVRRGTAELDAQWQIRYAGRLSGEATYLQERLTAMLGEAVVSTTADEGAPEKVVVLQVNSEDRHLPETAESYTLTIEGDHIVINGRDNAGVFYGVQSLLSLMPAEASAAVSLPRMTITDSPRAGWRGMHYDMGRNFHGKAVTLRLIEQMGRYKLNKLHLHLTEDEGWRLEIPGLPELTDIGAQRCFDLEETTCLLTQLGTGPFVEGSGNGYYSVEDFIEILRYAAARHIEVIPEIDMPGHARAAVKAMDARHAQLLAAGKPAEAQQYLLADPADTSEYITVQNYTDNSINVCLESTYAFVDKVMYELQQMYRQAGLKLSTFHMGGDEVGAGSWTASPVCDALFREQQGIAGPADLKPYFVSRVAALANQRGMALAGWEDGLMYDAANPFNRSEFDNPRVLANAWDNIWEWNVADRAYLLANSGYQVILSHATHLYFDHPHEAHPAERGYYWAARYTDVAKVFGYMPDHLYANASETREGEPINDLEVLLGRELTPLKAPENILGIQGQVWTETIRTPSQLEAMIYPRIPALAERAWHRADWEGNNPDKSARMRDFATFAHALALKDLPKMAAAGVNYHLLPPGGKLQDGKLYVNTEYPGLRVEYSLDGKQWQVYQAPIALEAEVILLRAVSAGRVSHSVELQAN
ncbi:MAG TPA: family 20 glycosylhydrolase [Cellvibrionaceae bacterium]